MKIRSDVDNNLILNTNDFRMIKEWKMGNEQNFLIMCKWYKNGFESAEVNVLCITNYLTVNMDG